MVSNQIPYGLTLGSILAFVAPGFLAMLGTTQVWSRADDWLVAAAQADQSVGVFLFVALTSLALGVIVSGVRALVVDTVLDHVLYPKRWRTTLPPTSFRKLLAPETLPGYLAIVENYLRFYQFYANTLVALIFTSILRRGQLWAVGPSSARLLIVFLAAALAFSAWSSRRRFAQALSDLL